jgi:hypothetical protein
MWFRTGGETEAKGIVGVPTSSGNKATQLELNTGNEIRMVTMYLSTHL